MRTADLSDPTDYTVASSPRDPGLAVAPKPLTWQVGNGSAVYGDALAGPVSLQGIVDGAPLVAQLGAVDADGHAVARPGAGTWSVGVASLAGDGSSNYTLSAAGSTNGRFDIAPRPVTWRVGDTSVTYGVDVTPGNVSYGNVLPGDSPGATVQVLRDGTPVATHARLDVGVYPEVVTGLANPNYVLDSAPADNQPGRYTVVPRAVSFATPDASSTYGSAATLGTGTLLPGDFLTGVLPGDLVFAGPTALQATGAAPTDRTNAGTWALGMPALAGRDAGNYVPTQAGSTLGTLTIAPKPVTYTMQGTFRYNAPFTDRTTDYGTVGAVDLPRGKGTVDGALAGDDVAITAVDPASMPLSTGGFLGVGSYTFRGGALTGAAAGNYVLQPTGNADATLQVRPLTLPDVFQDHDTPEKMYAAAGLNADGIVHTCLSALGRGAEVVHLAGKQA